MMIMVMHKMSNNKQPSKPFYHYPLLWRVEPIKRVRFPSQVKYTEEIISQKEENDAEKKRGRPKKQPRKVVVEDDDIVMWIVQNVPPIYEFENCGVK